MIHRNAPSTRYQGSKRKLLEWLGESIGDRGSGSVLDLMSGTASVSYFFKSKGLRVASNDYLKCNYLSAVALVENSDVHLTEDDLQFILTDPDPDDRTFIRSTFQGFFYTDDENVWLDRRLARIAALSEMHRDDTLRYKRALAFHSLAQVALMKRPFNLFHRKNLHLRTSDAVRKFGNKTTWDTPFEVLFRRLVAEVNSAVFSNGERNAAHNQLAEKLDVSEEYGLVYLDPPYFTRYRERVSSDYRFLYHFLEGMAQYDAWPELIDIEDGRHALKREYNESSPYISPIPEMEDILLSWFRSSLSPWEGSVLALSYKSPGIPSRDALVDLMRELRPSVSVYERPYQYALNRKNGLPGENIELLIIGDR